MVNKKNDDAATDASRIWRDVVTSRRSTRRFLTTDIPLSDVEWIIEHARLCPSGGNMQPWRVQILKRKTIDKMAAAIGAQIAAHGHTGIGDYRYYPSKRISPYSERIKQAGRDLLDSLHISLRDTEKIRRQKMRNFDFYGAPVGLIVTIDRSLEAGSWVDIGIFIGYLILAAQCRGLRSCAQASFSCYGDIVRKTLNLGDENLVICGIAIGKADRDAAINKLPLRRADISSFVSYHE